MTTPFVYNQAKTIRRRPLVIWLVLSQLIALASLQVWFVIASLSLSAFDSGYTPAAAIFVGSIWLYPLFPLLCAALAWLSYRDKRDILAASLTSLPILPAVLYLVWLLFA